MNKLKLPQDRILILDGAMGTMIQTYGLEEKDFRAPEFGSAAKELKGNNECLNFTHPEIIREIHLDFIDAGADMIETNSFSANRISQKEYGLQAYAREMALRAAGSRRRPPKRAEGRTGKRCWWPEA